MVYQRPLRSDELYHFGIKGMKWGVRKRRENVNKFYSRTGRKRRINIDGRRVAAGLAGAAGAAAAGYGAYRLVKSGRTGKLLERGIEGYDRLRNSRAARGASNFMNRTRRVRHIAAKGYDAVDMAGKAKYLYDNRNELKTKQGRRKMIERQKKTMRTGKWKRRKVADLAVTTFLHV